MTWALLDNEPLFDARVTMPYFGTWVADVSLAITQAVSAQPTLTLGDLVLRGTTFRVDTFAGQLNARIVGGGGGWRKQVVRRMYSNPAGISLSTILGDAAKDVGETLSIAADRQIGTSFVREDMPASRLLTLLAPTWWMDFAGTTHIAARDTSAITSKFDVLQYEGGRGRLQVATETLSDWTPGRTITAPTLPGTLTLGSVTHVAGNDGRNRVDSLVSASGDGTDALLGNFRALDRQDVPRQTFTGVYEYIVQGVSGSNVDAVPVDGTLGLPNVRAPVWGWHGVTSSPSVGSRCAVFFLDQNPAKPRAVAEAVIDSAVIAQGSALQQVARKGDLVAGGMFAITGPCSLKVVCG